MNLNCTCIEHYLTASCVIPLHIKSTNVWRSVPVKEDLKICAVDHIMFSSVQFCTHTPPCNASFVSTSVWLNGLLYVHAAMFTTFDFLFLISCFSWLINIGLLMQRINYPLTLRWVICIAASDCQYIYIIFVVELLPQVSSKTHVLYTVFIMELVMCVGF